MFSDIENLDIMLGGNHFNARERDECLNCNLATRPESAISNDLENDHENAHVNPRVIDSGNCAESDQNSATANSGAEINRLSSELNSRLSRELDETMGSVNTQIQRAISNAISNQILPQIQTALSAESGHLTQNKRNVPFERPEGNPEETYSESTKKNNGCEQRNDYQKDSQSQPRVYDMVT